MAERLKHRKGKIIVGGNIGKNKVTANENAVDDYVRESGFVPTLIESGRIGIATEVVKGAKATIVQHKPKLILLDYPDTAAISMIKAWVPEYQVYYSECGRGNYGVFFLSI